MLQRQSMARRGATCHRTDVAHGLPASRASASKTLLGPAAYLKPRSRAAHVCASSSRSDNTSTGLQALIENDRVVSALTSVGLSGSIAVVGAQIANLCGAHINLWEGFHWLRGEDLQVALRIGSILLFYEFFLLGVPWYSGLLDGKQLSSGKSIGSSAVDVARVLERIEEDAAEGTSPSSSDPLATSASRLAAPASTSTPSSQANPSTTLQSSASATDSPSSSQPEDTSQRSPFSMQLANPILQAGISGTTPSLPLLRATLAMQQACFVATGMVRSDIPPAVDAGLIFLRESSKELIQRGLFVTFLAAWLSDRCFEAGADDVVTLAGVLPLYTTDACRWIIATLASLLLLPPVLADASTLGLSVATNFAIMSTKMGDEPADDRVVQEYRLYEAMQRTVRALPAKITTALHETRGIMRLTSINAAFAATNNLSASLAIAVASNLLLLVYSTTGRAGLKLKRPTGPPKGRQTGKKPSA